MMICPSTRNFLDRVAHPFKSDWQREYDDANYKASFEIDQFQGSGDPVTQSLVNLGVKFQAKIENKEISNNDALLGVALALQNGLPAGPVSLAIASVGQGIVGEIINGRHPKRGGFDDPLSIAESFTQAATSENGLSGQNLEQASRVLKSGVHSSFNQITLARQVLDLVSTQTECNQEQAVALLARNVINDSRLACSDIQNVGMSALQWFAHSSENSQIREVAQQGIQGYEQRRSVYIQALENQPWWATSSSASGIFARGDEEHMVAELEQIFTLAGTAPLPASVSPEHRNTYPSELIWQAKRYVNG